MARPKAPDTRTPARINLEAEYRKLAKRADQRLVRLEQLEGKKHYENVTAYSYQRAMKDIKYYSGYEATRFNTKPPKSDMELKEKIADIKNFLNAPTSTKKGITTIYQKRADTVNKNYSSNFSWQDLANFYEREWDKKLSQTFGSHSMLYAIGQMKTIENKKYKLIIGYQEAKDKDGNPIPIYKEFTMEELAHSGILAQNNAKSADLKNQLQKEISKDLKLSKKDEKKRSIIADDIITLLSDENVLYSEMMK